MYNILFSHLFNVLTTHIGSRGQIAQLGAHSLSNPSIKGRLSSKSKQIDKDFCPHGNKTHKFDYLGAFLTPASKRDDNAIYWIKSKSYTLSLPEKEHSPSK